MGRSVRLSEAAARTALAWIPEDAKHPRDIAARAELREEIRRLAPVPSLADFDRIPKAPPKPRKPRRVSFNDAMADLRAQKVGVFARSRKPSKEEKKDRRAAIREKVFERAGGQCEGPAGSDPRWGGRCINPATDLQHVFGRGKGRMPESERNCLAACRLCHDAEGRNIPNGAIWWEWFAAWFDRHGFAREARAARKRAAFEGTRAALPASPRTVRP